MYLSKFNINGDDDIENSFEGYTDGTIWNGWANVFFTRQQVSALLDASPYDYRFLEPNTKLNPRDYPVLLIYYDDREEIIESTPIPTEDGDILEGYPMDDYCFIELV